jgi:hypothetical protein
MSRGKYSAEVLLFTGIWIEEVSAVSAQLSDMTVIVSPNFIIFFFFFFSWLYSLDMDLRLLLFVGSLIYLDIW